jgi:hypothetical protein
MSAINRFTAEILEGMNAFLAIALVAGGVIAMFSGVAGDAPFVIAVGLFCAVVLPGLICGPIAILIDIRDGIREIADDRE